MPEPIYYVQWLLLKKEPNETPVYVSGWGLQEPDLMHTQVQFRDKSGEWTDGWLAVGQGKVRRLEIELLHGSESICVRPYPPAEDSDVGSK